MHCGYRKFSVFILPIHFIIHSGTGTSRVTASHLGSLSRNIMDVVGPCLVSILCICSALINVKDYAVDLRFVISNKSCLVDDLKCANEVTDRLENEGDSHRRPVDRGNEAEIYGDSRLRRVDIGN